MSARSVLQSRAATGGRAASPGEASTLPQARISVGRLRLKLPAADAGSARRIVERASELAAERAPAGLAGHVHGLSLKVRPRNLSEAAITEAVADALVTALRRRGGDRA